MPPSFDDLYRAAIRLHQQGQADAAAQVYDELLRLQPGHYGALHLKGVLALQRHDYAAAAELIAQSLADRPAHDLALSNYGIALRALERHAEAIAALERAVALTPGSAEFWTNLAQTQIEAGATRDGLASARRAIALAPERLGPRQLLIMGSSYLAGTDPMALKGEAMDYAARLEALVTARSTHPNDPDPDRTIRLGLVSGDLRAHPVGRFLLALVTHIDPQRVAIHAYSDARQPDGITAAIRACCAGWRDTRGIDDVALGEVMAADGVDVAIDLSGYSNSVRLTTFATRPAPVSFAWLGYSATTGLSAIDYVLADRWVIPEGEAGQWVERPWRLPDTYLCFTAPADAPEPSPLPAARNGHVTFGSSNAFAKLSDPTLGAWRRLLDAVPGAHLLLRYGNKSQAAVDELAQRLQAAGIGPDRVRIDARLVDYATHLETYGEIDIALDPFPYNGATTTVEALFMGVPVLAVAGDRYVAHMGESILNAAGLGDWIAADEASYVALGAARAADLAALASLRAGLRGRVLASPLFDGPRFARNFEAAVRGMWRGWCATRGRG